MAGTDQVERDLDARWSWFRQGGKRRYCLRSGGVGLELRRVSIMAHVRFDYRSIITLGALLGVLLMWMTASWLATNTAPPQYHTRHLDGAHPADQVEKPERPGGKDRGAGSQAGTRGDIEVADAIARGAILASCGTFIVLAALAANFLWPKGRNAGWTVNIAFLAIIFMLYLMIFFFPNMRIKESLVESSVDWVRNCRLGIVLAAPQGKDDDQGKRGRGSELQGSRTGFFSPFGLSEANADTLFVEFIKAQHTKAVEEIKQRTVIDDTWYNNKFILVGALFAAFFTYSNLFMTKMIKRSDHASDHGAAGDETRTNPTSDIGRMFKTILPSSVLGMSCIVSLAIDLHIRSNGMITRQLGLWIQNYLECFISDTSRFMGWETFLRVDSHGNNIQGLHRDYLFNIIDSAHFYFTSITLYIIYIGCLMFYFSKNRCEPNEYPVFIFIFVLVHLTMLLFSVSGNFFPSTLEVQLALWKGYWFSGDVAGITPSVICLLVSGLAFMRLYTLHRNCDTRADAESGKVEQD